jgi:hypothetical protein
MRGPQYLNERRRPVPLLRTHRDCHYGHKRGNAENTTYGGCTAPIISCPRREVANDRPPLIKVVGWNSVLSR